MAATYDGLGNINGDDGVVTAAPVPLTGDKLSYVQQKIADFQQTLYDVDTTADMLWTVYVETDDDAQAAEIKALIDEYDSRKAAFKFAAESFNLASSAVNAVGGNMPAVTIPSGLGVFPLVPAVAYAAIATGALILIDWAHNWITVSYNTATKAIADIQKTNPGLAEQLNTKLVTSAAAQQSTTGNIATAAKWVGIAVLAWVAWQAFQKPSKD